MPVVRIMKMESAAARRKTLTLDIYGNQFRVVFQSRSLLEQVSRELRFFVVEPDIIRDEMAFPTHQGRACHKIYHINESKLREISKKKESSPGVLCHNLMCYITLCLRSEYLFFHGSAVSDCQKAAIFLGQSGSGKSTLALFAKYLGLNVLTDDVVMIRKKTCEVMAFPKEIQVRPLTYKMFNKLGYNLEPASAIQDNILSKVTWNGARVSLEPTVMSAKPGWIYLLEPFQVPYGNTGHETAPGNHPTGENLLFSLLRNTYMWSTNDLKPLMEDIITLANQIGSKNIKQLKTKKSGDPQVLYSFYKEFLLNLFQS